VRASFSELLVDATRRRAAVGAFTCYNLETAVGVLGAAEEAGTGVILMISPAALRSPGGPALLDALVAAAARSSAAACVQLDHAVDLDSMHAALVAGAGAIMADGSRLTLAENAGFVRRAVELARRYDAHVEAELGRIEGDEDLASAAAAGALTDPREAAAFVRDSGADCLAVSIGNAHGTYVAPPRLDLGRLEAIRNSVEAPLALHGASGLSDDAVRATIARGAAKVNVNTELRRRYLGVTAEQLEGAIDQAAVMALHRAQADAIAELVAQKLAVFASA
jgi:ketose-bisphosphate aldolase